MATRANSIPIPLSFWRGMPSGGGGLNRPQERPAPSFGNFAGDSHWNTFPIILKTRVFQCVSIFIHGYCVIWLKMSTFVNRNTLKFLCMSIFKNSNLK